MLNILKNQGITASIINEGDFGNLLRTATADDVIDSLVEKNGNLNLINCFLFIYLGIQNFNTERKYNVKNIEDFQKVGYQRREGETSPSVSGSKKPESSDEEEKGL
jgi:hypothetical protein